MKTAGIKTAGIKTAGIKTAGIKTAGIKTAGTPPPEDADLLGNPHPGVILREEFLAAFGLTQNGLARAIGVPGNRIHAIVAGTRQITADTDLRLCRFFRLSDGYFLRLQNAYDTLEARRRIADQLAQIKPHDPRQAA